MVGLCLPAQKGQAVQVYNWRERPQFVNQSCSQHPAVAVWQPKEQSAGTTGYGSRGVWVPKRCAGAAIGT